MKVSFLLKNTFKLAFVASSLFFASCSEDGNDILTEETPTKENLKKYIVTVNPTNEDTTERSVNIIALPNTTQKVTVNFTGESKMDRIYMTRNVSSTNAGPQAYEYDFGGALGVEKKRDGSIDLDGDDREEFKFTFDFETPTEVNDVIQYIIWTTTSRGDFRDVNNDNAVGDNAFATITITAGTGFEVTGVKEFSQTILAAPLADGSSKTFVSIFNNQTYPINDGDGTAALWDFGYFYGKTSKASFYSAHSYSNTSFLKVFAKDDITGLDVATFSGANPAELNRCYFKLSDKTTVEFDAITNKTDLDFITESTSESVQNLVVNNIVEFVDQYGNKGLIKVTKIEGTTGSDGKITFNVKVQVNAEPIKL